MKNKTRYNVLNDQQIKNNTRIYSTIRSLEDARNSILDLNDELGSTSECSNAVKKVEDAILQLTHYLMRRDYYRIGNSPIPNNLTETIERIQRKGKVEKLTLNLVPRFDDTVNDESRVKILQNYYSSDLKSVVLENVYPSQEFGFFAAYLAKACPINDVLNYYIKEETETTLTIDFLVDGEKGINALHNAKLLKVYMKEASESNKIKIVSWHYGEPQIGYVYTHDIPEKLLKITDPEVTRRFGMLGVHIFNYLTNDLGLDIVGRYDSPNVYTILREGDFNVNTDNVIHHDELDNYLSSSSKNNEITKLINNAANF